MLALIVKYASFLVISIFILCLAVGEFILWQALPVSCSNHEKIEENKVLKNLVIGIEAIEKELGDALEKNGIKIEEVMEELNSRKK